MGSTESTTQQHQLSDKAPTLQGNQGNALSDLQIPFWVVAFLDLLGYRSILEKIDVFPLRAEALPTLERAFKRAIHFRRRLLHHIDNLLADDEESTSDLSQLPLAAREITARWRTARVIRTPAGNYVVASKYAWLIDYMRPRLSPWGYDAAELDRLLRT